MLTGLPYVQYSDIAEMKLQGLFLSERHGEQLKRSILDEHPTDGLRVNDNRKF